MTAEKIKSREQLAVLCDKLRSKNLTIGFTSGAFDLLHAGHADYLEQTKQYCDVLVVGVNSDQSVRRYKGEDRPIIAEKQRAKLVAALHSVDYVFIFDERRNEKNIRALKPDFYFKAGDYSSNQLTSKSVIEELGGRVQLIPISENISTTQILEKLVTSGGRQESYREDEHGIGYFQRKSLKKAPAIFLDRDGTINLEVDYLSEPEKFRFLPNAIDGLQQFQNMGFWLIIITNQPGIGMGYYTREDFYKVNKKMLAELSSHNILIDKIYFCPHSMAEKCHCRKPGTGLIERAQLDMNIDIDHSYFIGDSWGDIEAGNKAGMRTILINAGCDQKRTEQALKYMPNYTAADLVGAARIVLQVERD